MTDYLQMAESYYQAMSEKDLAKVKNYWHPEVRLISPFAKEAQAGSISDAMSRFMAAFTSLKIRSKFSSGNQVMLAIDVEYPLPIGKLTTAVLMTFRDNLIGSIELFHDTKPFHAFG